MHEHVLHARTIPYVVYMIVLNRTQYEGMYTYVNIPYTVGYSVQYIAVCTGGRYLKQSMHDIIELY